MKINKLFFASLAILATLVGCKEKEEAPLAPSLNLDKTEVELGKEGGSATVTLTTNRDWTATPSAEWITVEPESGSASDDAQSVTITVLPNTGNNRTGSVSFSIGLAKKSVSVSQLGEGGAVQEGEGTKESPYTVAKALEIVNALGADQQTETAIYVKGIICSMKDGNADAIKNFGNASYYISDDGTDAKESRILIFQSFYLGNVKFTSEDQIKVGDEVVVYGKFVNYYGNTPETVGKGSSYIYSLNGEVSEGGNVEVGDQKGSGTEADPFNPAAAIAKCIEIGQTESAEEYYVKGIVSRIAEINTTQYKNAKFYISEDGSTKGEFYVYACSYLGGEAFVSEDQLKVGDEVVVKGKLVNYYGNTPEMTKGCSLVSINGGSTGGDYLSVSVKTKTVAADAGSFTFDVTSNQDWTVASDDAFVTVSPASGSGNGTVTVTYTKNEGETRTANVTVKAASGEEKVVLTQYDKDTTPAVTLTWSKNDWKEVGDPSVIVLEKDGYKITVDKQSGVTNPNRRDDGCIRAYAKALITIESAVEMQSIVFALEDKMRTAAITADSGSVATQSASDDVVSWTGNANKVSFTVGDKAVYGSDGADKAGQLRFKSITIQQ